MRVFFLQILKDAANVAFPEIEVKQKDFNLFQNPWMSKGLLISSKTKQKILSKKTKIFGQVNVNNLQNFNIVFNKCF